MWDIRSDINRRISLGICLPSACSINQLESSINRAVHEKMSNMTVRIPQSHCQFDERYSDWRLKDFVIM